MKDERASTYPSAVYSASAAASSTMTSAVSAAATASHVARFNRPPRCSPTTSGMLNHPCFFAQPLHQIPGGVCRRSGDHLCLLGLLGEVHAQDAAGRLSRCSRCDFPDLLLLGRH